MRAPLVSIIIPTFNRAELLEYSFQSAVAQTYQPIEIIIVDDGSVDKTPILAKRWMSEYSTTIRYLQLPHRGACAARNEGLRQAAGEYIQFLDSDDLLHPQKIEAQMQVLRQCPDAGMCGAAFTEGPEPPSGWTLHDERRSPLHGVQVLSNLSAWSYLFRRSLLDRVGPWNEQLGILQDIEYMTRIAHQVAGRSAMIPRPLYFYRRHADQRITLGSRNCSGIERRLEALRLMESQPSMSSTHAQAVLRAYCLGRAPLHFYRGNGKQRREFWRIFKALNGTWREKLQMQMAAARMMARRMRARGAIIGALILRRQAANVAR